VKKYLLLILLLTSCTDHGKVMDEYEKGNKNASDLLLHGLQRKNSEYISTELIEKALKGDEEAKQIIYAQIATLGGVENENIRHRTIVIPKTRNK
jgi:hypothetical protein